MVATIFTRTYSSRFFVSVITASFLTYSLTFFGLRSPARARTAIMFPTKFALANSLIAFTTRLTTTFRTKTMG